jgi:16S rRNA U516 pseudouridylate synthase RsuA-like enzyme
MLFGAARPKARREEAPMDEDRFNMAVRKFLKQVGVTSQREIERVVREGQVQGRTLRLRMTLTSDDAPLRHVVEETIALD